jgi:4-amino-4-deoxy-L-arabinose transferase-like glycosyltransferase
LHGGTAIAGLGVLTKITAACLLLAWPVIALGVYKGRSTYWSIGLLLVACLPAIWWYYAWVPHLVETYGYWHFFMGKSMLQGARELWDGLARTLDNFYFDAMRYSGSLAFCYGMYVLVRTRNRGGSSSSRPSPRPSSSPC